jgi:hypothetical protein
LPLVVTTAFPLTARYCTDLLHLRHDRRPGLIPRSPAAVPDIRGAKCSRSTRALTSPEHAPRVT